MHQSRHRNDDDDDDDEIFIRIELIYRGLNAQRKGMNQGNF